MYDFLTIKILHENLEFMMAREKFPLNKGNDQWIKKMSFFCFDQC